MIGHVIPIARQSDSNLKNVSGWKKSCVIIFIYNESIKGTINEILLPYLKNYYMQVIHEEILLNNHTIQISRIKGFQLL